MSPSSPLSLSPEDAALIGRWLDGRATPAEVAALDARLPQEPALAQALLAAARTEADCRRLLGGPAQALPDLRAGTTTGRIREWAELAPSAGSAAPRRRSSPTARPRRSRRSPRPRSLARFVPLAAFGLCALLLWWWWPQAAAPSPQIALATSAQPLWVERAGQRLQTRELQVGDGLQQAEGVLELVDGSRLRLHQASLQLPGGADDRRWLLHGGGVHLRAASPRWELVSPHLEVRVRGTAYALQVDQAGSQLRVESGQVEARALTPQLGPWQSLGPGQELRIAAQPLVAQAQPRWEQVWRSDFSRDPGLNHGRWLSDRVRSEPREISSTEDNRVYPGQSVAITAASQPLFFFGPEHRLRLRLRSARAQRLNVMLVSNDPASGNWQANLIAYPELEAGDHWQEVTLTWEDFSTRVPPERVAALAEEGLPVASWNIHALTADGVVECAAVIAEAWMADE